MCRRSSFLPLYSSLYNMSSSFSRSFSAILIIALCVIGCGQRAVDWSEVSAADNGGFTVQMPAASGIQHGRIPLGMDTVATHINILADSGITYVASWFDIPARLSQESGAALLDSVWAMLGSRVDGELLDGPGPLDRDFDGLYHGWFVDGSGTRLGLVVLLEQDRAIVLNASTPNDRFAEREQRNMVRFLRSYRKSGME